MSTLDTNPASIDVTTDAIDAWAIDFSAAVEESETIASAEAVLVSTASTPNREVAGFVTGASVDGMTVTVSWTGESLNPGSDYVLHTRSVLDTGAVVVLLTQVVCRG